MYCRQGFVKVNVKVKVLVIVLIRLAARLPQLLTANF